MLSVIGTHVLGLSWRFKFGNLRQIAKLKTLPKFPAIQCNIIIVIPLPPLLHCKAWQQPVHVTNLNLLSYLQIALQHTQIVITDAQTARAHGQAVFQL